MSQLQKKFVAANAIDETKIRLSNGGELRARNAADSGDVNILAVDGSDRIVFASVPQSTSDAIASNDLVRYSQLQALADGMKPKQAVAVASTGNIDLSVAADPSPVDGYTLADGDRILLWQQTADAENGIYIANTAADPTTWTRSSDFDIPSEIPGSYTVAEFGTVGQGVLYVCLSAPATIGTDPINFAIRQITVNTYTGGDMISIDGGNVISVDLAAVSGLQSTDPGNADGQLQIKLEASNPSLQINGSNELGVKIDTSSGLQSTAAGVGINLDPAGSLTFLTGALAVNVDDSTIEISGDALQVKDAGITLAKLASDSVDENKIVSTALSSTGALAGGSGTKLSVKVDAATVKINGSDNLESLKHSEETITLSGTDITNQFIDLAHAVWGTSASVNSVSLTPIGGPLQQKTVDYTVSLTGGSGGVTRVTFAGDLATGGPAALVAGDILAIDYDFLT